MSSSVFFNTDLDISGVDFRLHPKLLEAWQRRGPWLIGHSLYLACCRLFQSTLQIALRGKHELKDAVP
ncbi:hypothetical protein RRG08_036634 [Elysia crispata]|uniref:Uncharacterized protein n=1 Tax=Elysia crispata TaxID=231223 RepID=A0AAE1D3N3_9GAST|nr:hypothetical protein RRG08_036634 [Elysia crispata]